MSDYTSPLDEEIMSFETFVEQSSWKLRQYALSLLPVGAIDTADDLVQEAYMRVFEHIRRGSFVPVSCDVETPDMMRYMRVVIKRLFLDMVLNNRSNEQSFDNQSQTENYILSLHDSDEYANVEQTVLRWESSAELYACVDRLPKRMQLILKLKLDGLSSQEIADMLAITPGAVRVSAMRARQSLHERMTRNSQTVVVLDQQKKRNSHRILPADISNIAQLPDPYKIILGLHRLRQMSYSEIAKKLNKPVGTVKSLCSRGGKLLQMQDCSGDSLHTAHQEAVDITCVVSLDNAHLLDEHLRQVIELHSIQQLSYAQIAKRLGRSEGTIKGWVSRARNILRQHTQAQSMPKKGASSLKRRTSWTPEELEYIENMPPDFRNVMKGFYREHLSVSQIAMQQNISIEAVKAKIKQGRKCVKEHASSYHVRKQSSH